MNNQPQARELPFEFTGSASEYFRIFIVNVALSVLTLGIYSAWAKVRTKRYFYRHTILDGAAFEYLANPLAILKGRIIVAILLLAFLFGGQYVPQPLVTVAILCFIPFLVIRGMAFSLRNTSYRNVRFSFNLAGEGLYKGYGWQVLVLFFGWLVYSRFVYWRTMKAFTFGGFGRSGASIDITKRQIDVVYGNAYGLVVLLGFVVIVGALVLSGGLREGPWFDLATILIYAGFITATGWKQAKMGQLIWNNAEIAAVRFRCTMNPRHTAWIYFSNALAIVASIGLAIPWATVRTVRYRAENMVAIVEEDLAGILAGQGGGDLAATGSEAADLLDLGFGF